MTGSDPGLSPDLIAALEPLRSQPKRGALLLDFDGTLSPTVADPARAVPAPGVADLLASLTEKFARVAVISGRPLSFLIPLLPEEVELSGQYGLEHRPPNGPVSTNSAERWSRATQDALAALGELPHGVVVEPKGLSVTVHYRLAPEAQDLVAERVQHAAEAVGLAVHRAKASYELRPPVNADKATVALELLRGVEHALYMGDDLGDLPAMLALDGWARPPRTATTVAVRSTELPAELQDAAHHVIDGVPQAVALLKLLAQAGD